MPSIKIKDDLYKEISEYCKLNSLSIVEYVNEKLKNAIINEKYGDIPFGKLTHDIPPRPIAEEIIPVMPINEPDGNSLLPKIDELSKFNEKNEESRLESGQVVSIEAPKTESRQNEQETNNIQYKPKKRRL